MGNQQDRLSENNLAHPQITATEILERNNSLLTFGKTVAAQQTTRPTVLLFLRVYLCRSNVL